MRQKQQTAKWHTDFFIREQMPFAGELYSIKIEMAIYVRDRQIDQEDETILKSRILAIARSNSQEAKDMLNRILDFALECAIANNSPEIIEKTTRYKAYLLPKECVATLSN